MFHEVTDIECLSSLNLQRLDTLVLELQMSTILISMSMSTLMKYSVNPDGVHYIREDNKGTAINWHTVIEYDGIYL